MLNSPELSKNKRKQRSMNSHFIAAWIRSPMTIGAALPSSRGLSRAMAAQVDMTREGAIIDLGAGTGVVTHALIEAGAKSDKLLVIERDKKLFALLHSIFHDYKVLCADATELQQVIQNAGMNKVNAVVSSLPFLSMPVAIRHSIQEQMAKVIGDDGIIVQFTYGPKSPIDRGELKRLGLTGKRVKIILINVPPAHVWVYRRA